MRAMLDVLITGQNASSIRNEPVRTQRSVSCRSIHCCGNLFGATRFQRWTEVGGGSCVLGCEISFLIGEQETGFVASGGVPASTNLPELGRFLSGGFHMDILSFHAIAAARGDGLRPELLEALSRTLPPFMDGSARLEAGPEKSVDAARARLAYRASKPGRNRETSIAQK
jgi:hypothetical protein